MPTTGKLIGKNVMLYVDDGVSAGPVPVGCATSTTLGLTQEMVDATCKDSDGWNDAVPSQRGFTAEVEGLVILDNPFNVEQAADLILNQTKVTIKFSTEVSGDVYFEGEAYATDFSVEAGVNEVATYSLSLQGVGPLIKATVA